MKTKIRFSSLFLSVLILLCSVSFPMSALAQDDYVKVGGAGGVCDRFTYYSKDDKLVIDSYNRYLPDEFINYSFYEDEYFGGFTWEKGDEQLNDKEIRSIKSVCINNGVTIIGSEPFYALESLEEVTLPKSLKRILAGTFSKTKNLKAVNFGGSQEEWNAICIDKKNDCLDNIKVNFNVDVDDSKYNGNKNEDVVYESRYISDSIKINLNYYTGEANIVGTGAIPNVSNDYGLSVDDLFGPQCYDCIIYPLVQKIYVSEGITEIGKWAFANTSAVEIHLPKSVEKISSTAFHRSDSSQKLKTVYYNGSVADWDKIIISKTDNDELSNAKLVFANKATTKDITATLSKTKYIYDTKSHTPSVSVKNTAGKTLVRNKDYKLTYSSDRTKVGKYTVKITFQGDYSGTVSKTFTIVPKNTTISNLTAVSKGFTVKWKKQATQTTGYQIQIATNSTFTKGVKTYAVSKNSTVSKKIAKLTGKKKYYVRIRTYKTKNNVNYYSSWSAKKYVTTKK